MNTVLLIDDDANSVALLEDAFQFNGLPAQLVTVETGEDALIQAVELRPALILMNQHLPGIDGLETTRLLKQDPATKDIPIWAISAAARNEDEVQARAAGCCEYITKPVHFAELVNRFRTFLDQLGSPIVRPAHGGTFFDSRSGSCPSDGENAS